MVKTVFRIIFIFVFSMPILAQWVVATDGNDDDPGTLDKPFRSITKAVSGMAQGDTIYVRGGVYELSGPIDIGSSKSGSSGKGCYLFSFPDEKPLLDFSKTELRTKGIILKAGYWHIRGFDVKGAGDNGMEISGGSNNIIEFCSFYENRDTGFQLSNGASNNQIVNCDSYYNADPPDYQDADGFAPKLTVGSGNAFYGCRSWGNCDDGWDGYLRGADDVTTTLQECWTWGNGYMKDGTDPGPKANGNGFKMGGGDNSNSLQLMHHFILIKCLSFENKDKGFDQNHNAGSMTLLNCTAFANKGADYRITEALKAGQTLTVKNSVSLAGNAELGSFAVQEKNGWLQPFSVTEDDFLSVDPTSASAPRKIDGGLPDIDFMHLAEGSDLIDAGVDLGFPFYGSAPDLGAFESDYVTFVSAEKSVSPVFKLYPNYPNPFNPVTSIRYALAQKAEVRLAVYDVLGRRVKVLVNEIKPSGEHRVDWQGIDDRGLPLPGGVYFYRITAGRATQTGKALLIR
jgi:hypothetical protein